MSALPPKADIGTQPRNVRFVPEADNIDPVLHYANDLRIHLSHLGASAHA